MKYPYKKQMKMLLILFFLLTATQITVAQIPGTPYGLTALSPATIPAGAGSFAGRTCFDVALVNNGGACGNLSSRQSETLTANGSRADFSNTLTRNQTYAFTPSGTVSNVRFYVVEAGAYAGQIIESISGGNSGNNISSAVSCNIVYKSDLNGKASGKTNANALTVDIYAVYNDNAAGTGTDKQIKLNAIIKDCACCGAYTTSGNWLTFMCYNLGADPTLTTPDQIKNAPTSQTYGHYYQWGKKLAWPTAGSVSGWNSGSNTVVDGAGFNYDRAAWFSGSGKTAADPCPAGYRMPTRAHWNSIFSPDTNYGESKALENATANTWVWSSTTPTTGLQIGQSLFLPAAGRRGAVSGSLDRVKEVAWYWTAEPHTVQDDWRAVSATTATYYIVGPIDGANACPLRCVAP
jgi:uncharacterized protein (TIGR02145 family)